MRHESRVYKASVIFCCSLLADIARCLPYLYIIAAQLAASAHQLSDSR